MVIYTPANQEKVANQYVVSVMDHGQQLKISGWQMAGIKFV